MRWCLRVKLAQNWHKFSNLLIETGDLPIVEQSRKDDFWGAIPNTDNQTLVGCNALGRLLMELREAVTNSWPLDDFLIVEPIDIPDFKLDNRTIEPVEGRALLAPETVGDVQKPMVEVRDERAKQLGFNLKEPPSRPVHQVQERTESNQYGQVRSRYWAVSGVQGFWGGVVGEGAGALGGAAIEVPSEGTRHTFFGRI